MALGLIAHLLNLLCSTVLLGFSLVFLRRYPNAFFRAWTTAFACNTGYIGTAMLLSQLHDPLALRLVAYACLSAAAAWLFKACALLLGRPASAWQRWVPVGGFVGSTALALGGVSHAFGTVPAGVINSIALVMLGATFLREVRTPSHPKGIRWLGWPLILLGLLPVLLPFPLVMRSGYDWLGFGTAGLLQATAAIGMLLYLTEEHWARELLEQRKLNRLKDELIAMIAHEVRTPLTSILGYVEFLE
ncbi:MAG TPA: histidine kinase dimerization/phospho-acceptor domain-containing protein, partial [Oscillatoriaceae cyanobacterium]